jgi:hypothetical protein
MMLSEAVGDELTPVHIEDSTLGFNVIERNRIGWRRLRCSALLPRCGAKAVTIGCLRCIITWRALPKRFGKWNFVWKRWNG